MRPLKTHCILGLLCCLALTACDKTPDNDFYAPSYDAKQKYPHQYMQKNDTLRIVDSSSTGIDTFTLMGTAPDSFVTQESVDVTASMGGFFEHLMKTYQADNYSFSADLSRLNESRNYTNGLGTMVIRIASKKQNYLGYSFDMQSVRLDSSDQTLWSYMYGNWHDVKTVYSCSKGIRRIEAINDSSKHSWIFLP